jgi:hypothetical protein
VTSRVADLEAQRQLRDEIRYVLKLRRVLQSVEEPLPGARGLSRLNSALDQLPRPGWLARFRP